MIRYQNTMEEPVALRGRPAADAYCPSSVKPDGVLVGRISRFLTLSGWSLRLYDFQSEADLHQSRQLDPVFVISVMLSGAVRFCSDKGGEVIDFTGGYCSLIYTESPVYGMMTIPASTRVSSVELRFPPHAVEAFLSTSTESLAGCLNRLSGHRHAGLAPVQFPTPPVIRGLAADMLCKGVESGCDRLWQEAWSLEILAHVLRKMEECGVADSSAPVSLSHRDRRKIAEAHQMMLGRLDHEWSIRELAAAVGLNENKLKRGFSHQFGSSVYACLQKHRITMAGELLREGADTVTDVALAVGYSSPAHFAKVFRRYHGVSPREFRRT